MNISNIFKQNIEIHYCASVTVTNVSITVAIGTNGLVVVNIMLSSTLCNVLVVLYHKTPISINDIAAVSNGMLTYYFQSSNLLAT